MKAIERIEEDSDTVTSLARGKTRMRVGGRTSVYRLRNGWIAKRQTPESGWARQAYWTIYRTDADYQNNVAIGGGEGRLTRAIANVINQFSSTAASMPPARENPPP